MSADRRIGADQAVISEEFGELGASPGPWVGRLYPPSCGMLALLAQFDRPASVDLTMAGDLYRRSEQRHSAASR